MIPSLRKSFNAKYDSKKSQEITNFFQNLPIYKIGYKISETPIFLDKAFGKKLYDVSESIVDQLLEGSILSNEAVPKDLKVPYATDHFHFLAIDFGICMNDDGEIEPQLIELQGFPSLFFYQKSLVEQYQEKFDIPTDLSVLPHRAFDADQFSQDLKDIIVGEYDPHNVVLLDIKPKEQKTGVDFALTKEALGIKPVCITEIFRELNDLYYIREGVETPIYRIYNRLICDDLMTNDALNLNFELTDKVHVDWITHPDWFFKISKYILPKLKHTYIPKAYFLKDFPSDQRLTDYVLKPLFSFAGKGVIIHPTQQDLDNIEHPENYILQEKKLYAPIFEDIHGGNSKAEIRLLYTWKEGDKRPEMQMNLVRMTKADKVNVDHLGGDLLWTGSSVAFFEQ